VITCREFASSWAPCLLAAILSLLGTPSCASPYKRATPVSELPPEELSRRQVANVENYRIGPGDELEIRFFHTPDLDVILPVRPDGRISLPLVRDTQAAGLTPAELENNLVQRYGSELRTPEISVIVRTFQPLPVHVGGEVDAPGVVAMTSTMTVFEAIMQAGGLLPTARADEIIVIRQSADGPHQVLRLNLLAAMDGRDTLQNIPLRAYDLVYVPRSPIARVNLWIHQYIRENIPISFGYRLEVR
jgi:protein involved in polysaccharide export with SLBB domain